MGRGYGDESGWVNFYLSKINYTEEYIVFVCEQRTVGRQNAERATPYLSDYDIGWAMQIFRLMSLLGAQGRGPLPMLRQPPSPRAIIYPYLVVCEGRQFS